MEKVFERIVPLPQIAERRDGQMRLCRGVRVALTVPGDPERVASTAVGRLRAFLLDSCGADALAGGDGAVSVTLARGEAPPGVRDPEEGYEIAVTEKEIRLTGFGESGLLYAVVTLEQLA